MKNKDYKSLEEVWEMKETVWTDFQKSGFASYVEYIDNEMVEIQKKYNIIIDYQLNEKNLLIV